MSNDELTLILTESVWSALNEYHWFGKHVEDAQLDSMWHSINDKIQATLDKHMPE